MQNQTLSSSECPASEAVVIESLLEQAQNSLLNSSQQSQFGEKKVMLKIAKKIAEDVLVLDGRNSDAHHILALSHTLLGESSRAKRHIAKAFEFSEASDILKLEKVHIDLAAGHYNKAEAGFIEVLQQEPTNVDAFLGIAITKQKKKDWGAAFLHYNSLINKNIIDETIIGGLNVVLPHIDVELWSADYERTILSALTHSSGDNSNFAKVSNSLLIHKYNLAHDDAQLDFAELIDDRLLLLTIQQKLIVTPEIEGLVTILRDTLLNQICMTKDLPEILQDWVIALAEAAVYFGYSWPITDSEAILLNDLSLAIKAESGHKDIVENCAGAIMLYSMYEELYAAPFSFLLMAKSLTEWPAKLQAILASSLYEPAHLHAVQVELKQVISPSQSSLIYERATTTPFPKWHDIHIGEEQSATRFFLDTFGERLPFKARKRPLNVLVSASGTGKHCLQMAAQYSDINLTGADSNIAHLAYAEYQARNLEIDNVRWVQCEEIKLTCLNQRFDLVDWTSLLNNSDNPLETLRHIKKLMATTGVAKLRVELNWQRDTENLLKKLASKNQLPANLDTLRNVRRAIIEDSNKEDWQALLCQPRFYHSGSCMNMLFGKEHRVFKAAEVDSLLTACQLEVIGITDNGIDRSDSSKCKNFAASSIATWESASPLTLETPKSATIFVKMA